ncbi:LOW QUALITY PROTEIN: Hypothetical protein PHPALM_17153 [Phytophthora palmivora]|uniref:Uncharacterized protein n=1 Tax=Phytophthora palmivora TaxID=4796 RepID=A0A2P4XMZ3_9STRA|nr:LOW QUALITY PROTEIN: Hypothetical protein PHPALM_17153 [Phytophthora palmivora]
MNVTKTEITTTERHTPPAGGTPRTQAADELRRLTKKLARSSVIAKQAQNSGSGSTYTAMDGLAPNALIISELRGMESFHRRHLQKVLNIRYPAMSPNQAPYDTCKKRSLRVEIISPRWGLFGHILRCPDIPA